MHRPFVFLIAFCLCGPALRAEDSSLGEVEVLAGRTDSPGGVNGSDEARHDSTAFTSVITAKDLKDRRTSVGEALQELGGVEVKQRGGLDDFATVSIRGSTSEQVAIYVDGLLMNQGFGGAPNIAEIPSDLIDRIEVYKGAAPARFGSSALGGVVHIVTKKAAKGRSSRTTEITNSYGSFNSYEGSVFQAQSIAPFSYDAGYTFTHSDGDFTFLDNNGTPFNPADDRVVKRVNNDFSRHNLSTGFSWRPEEEGIEVSFHNQFFREDRGIPGLATLTSRVANLSTTRDGVSVEVFFRNLLSRFDLKTTPYFQFQKQQFADPLGDIGLGLQDNDNDTYQFGDRLEGLWLAGRHQRVSAHLEYRGEFFLPEDFSKTPSSGPHSRRNGVSFSLEDEIVLADERIVLTPAFRTEHVFDDQSGVSTTRHPVSGKIGIKYQPWGPDGLAVFKTNFSRSYRLPSFAELFGDRGTFVGNPSLSPEKGWNWDIGAILTKKPVRFEVSYYLNQVDDLIQMLQTSQFTVQARNLSSARIQGVETNASADLFRHLELSANYTFQWAKDTSGLPGLNGKFLPGRPVHEASGRATLYNRWGKLFADLTFRDDNFLDTQNVLRADNRVLLTLGANATFWRRLTTGFEAKNLLNDRISDIVGFPLPGRSYYGKLSVKL